MKRLFSTWEFKSFNKRRALRSQKRRKKAKEKKRKKRKSEQGLSRIKVRHKRAFDDKFEGYVKVVAPENFTLIGNPEPVIRFINKLRECFEKKKKAFVVLQNVQSIDYDAIVVLLSIMVRFKAKNIPFNGDFPENRTARQAINESGFFYNLNRRFNDDDRYDVRTQQTSIHTHAWKNVDSVLSAKLIENASKIIWGEPRRCQGAQRTLLELMQNTNNHASASQGERHWWLSVNHRKEEKKACFSFVDYGVGVFESLANKPAGTKFFNAIGKMLETFRHGNNAELLKLILDGDLHRTVTGEHYRGKGLPGIAEALKRNQISNLHIVTNDVFGDVSNKKYRLLKEKIAGTFIYWELNYDNINCHGAISN